MPKSLYPRAQRLARLLWPWLFAAGIVMVAYFYALRRIYTADFVPTNGDFQTYNTLQRVLAGQIPYRDFANYLGMGVLFVNVPPLLLENSFIASLFVTNFMAKVLFILAAYMLMVLVGAKKPLAAIASLLLTRLVDGAQLEKIPALGYYFNYNLNLMASPGNSMRIVRSFLPFLLAGIFWAIARLYARKKGQTLDINQFIGSWKFNLLMGLLFGAGVVWSNDFGFACIGAAMLVLAVLLFHKYGRKVWHTLRALLVFAGGCGAGALTSILLCTRGSLGAYLHFTSGVASYQYWYYGVRAEEKLHSVADLLGEPHLMIQTGIYLAFIAWALWRMAKGRLSLRNLLLVFVFTSVFLATYLYIYASGSYGFTEALTFVEFFCGLGLLLYGLQTGFARLLQRPKAPQQALRVAAACVFLLYTGFLGYSALAQTIDYSRQDFTSHPDYIPALGGTTQRAEELRNQQQLVDGTPFFSTYATALDLMEGQMHPTGIDYIIHAMGDEQRQEYIQQFLNGEYEYVQTLTLVNNVWEPWIIRANWDFYAYIYKNYIPVLRQQTWTVWQRLPEGQTAALESTVQLQMEQRGSSEVHIEVCADNVPHHYCFAEVTLSYSSRMVMNLHRLQTWKHSVWVEDGNDLFTLSGIFLPTEAQSFTVPIVLEYGRGSLTLSSLPEACTALEILSVEIGEIVPVY